MPSGHESTRIYKSSISPKIGYKLGANATWSKVKHQVRSIPDGSKLFRNKSNVVEFGHNGEVFVGYSNSIEVWDWVQNALELNELDAKGVPVSAKRESRGSSEEVLYLAASLYGVNGKILNINPIECNQLTNTYTVILCLETSANEYKFKLVKFGQFFEEESIDQSLILPPSVNGSTPFSIESSKSFVGIATNEGDLTIFHTLKNQPLSTLSPKCLIINDRCLFTISGNYLAYVPAHLQLDKSEKLTNLKIRAGDDSKSVYLKFLKLLSLNTLDGLSKLPELKNKFNSQDSDFKKVLHDYILDFINGFKKDQSIVKIVDLVNEKEIGSFQPTNGVSNLSLSTFNDELVTTSKRGDEIYNWDLTRLPNQISLIDFQIRGKTSSIVEEIFWFSSNLVFIITRSSGSIHCFEFTDFQYSSNWVLSNMKCCKLSKPLNNSKLIALNNDLDKIFVIDPSNGLTNSCFQLTKMPIPKSLLPSYIKTGPVDDELVVRNVEEDGELSEEGITPLSQIEIETCEPNYPIFLNNHNIEVRLIKNGENFSYPKLFGQELEGLIPIQFNEVKVNEANFHGNDDSELIDAMNSLLTNDGTA